ncbi:MAG: hypothetical protein J6A49_06785 [Clostridia bacterium]|nr:hypothetical protein [Clostridia bacterium]
MSKKNKQQKSYYDRVHGWGRISTLSALCVLLMFPMAICLYLGVFPRAELVFKGLLQVIPLYWTVAVVEVVFYTPMLGAGGTYLSFVTGNIVNLKLPCAISAMENAKVKATSEEGDVISTIAIATSAIVTTAVLAVGVIAFAPFLDTFTNSPLLMPAFKQVIPALFGALGAGYFVTHWKISFAPILFMLLILVFVPTIGASTLIFPGIIASVLFAFVMYKVGFLDKKEKRQK